MPSNTRAAVRRNFAVNVVDGGFFGFAIGAASFVTVLPLFVSNLTDSAILIALVPAIHTLGWQLPQLLTAQRVARLRRFLPFVLQMTLHERWPYLGLIAVALALPHLSAPVALALTFALLVWQGFGGGFTATAWQSMIAKIMPSHRIGFFFGAQSAAAALGGAVAAALAGWVLAALAFPLNFAAVFGIAAVAMTVSWLFLASTDETPHEPAPLPDESAGDFLRRLPAILRADRNFGWFVVSRWLAQVGFMGSAFYSVFAVQHHGLDEVAIGLYTSVMLVSQTAMSPVGGWLGDRWGHRAVLGGGAVALAGSALVAWAAPAGGWFALAFALAGVAQASYWAAGNAMVLDLAPDRDRQTYIGLANTLMAPAAIVAPLLGGALADGLGYGAAFLASAVGATLTALLLFAIVRDPRPRRPARMERHVQELQGALSGD